jgi:hypothetical protein
VTGFIGGFCEDNNDSSASINPNNEDQRQLQNHSSWNEIHETGHTLYADKLQHFALLLLSKIFIKADSAFYSSKNCELRKVQQ